MSMLPQWRLENVLEMAKHPTVLADRSQTLDVLDSVLLPSPEVLYLQKWMQNRMAQKV
jgi:hypothetical protein